MLVQSGKRHGQELQISLENETRTEHECVAGRVAA